MNDRREMVVGRVLPVILALLLVLVLAEISLRFTGSDGYEYRFTEDSESREFRQFNPAFGWTHGPGSSFLMSVEGGEWNRYSHNSLGFRDTYDTGNSTVMLLGDSFTYGWGVGDNETYPHLLEEMMPGTAVRNFGMEGFGTSHQLLLYREHGEDFSGDTVVLNYYLGNDAKNNIRHLPPDPVFAIENGDLVLREPPRNESMFPGTEDPVEGSALYSRWQEISGDDTFDPREHLPTQEEQRRQFRLTRALLEELSAEVESDGAELLVVVIPARGEVQPSNPYKLNATLGREYWGRQRDLLRNFTASSSNVEMADFKPVAEDCSRRGQVYMDDGPHLTAYGNSVLASFVYREISSGEPPENLCG